MSVIYLCLHFLLLLRQHPGTVFQQDNACPYMAHVHMYGQSVSCRGLPMCAMHPDQSPIEHQTAISKYCFHERVNMICNNVYVGGKCQSNIHINGRTQVSQQTLPKPSHPKNSFDLFFDLKCDFNIFFRASGFANYN